MRAFAIDNFGETGSLRDLPAPEPAAGEVRIRVVAAGVSPVDVAVTNGYVKEYMEHRFPLIVGMDASGVVDAVGQGVEAWAVDDEVFGTVGKPYMGAGTYAELATLSVETIARKPPSVDHATTAGVANSGVTALDLVDALAVGDGDTVVAVGASGGVGSFLVQLARNRGARVVAVCSGANAAYLRDLGAEDVIDYTTGDVVETVGRRYPEGIDAIADMHGDKESITRLSGHLHPGRGVASSAFGADVDALTARGFTGANIVAGFGVQKLTLLGDMLVSGSIRLPAVETMPLDDAAAALAKIATKHVRGKLVLIVS